LINIEYFTSREEVGSTLKYQNVFINPLLIYKINLRYLYIQSYYFIKKYLILSMENENYDEAEVKKFNT